MLSVLLLIGRVLAAVPDTPPPEATDRGVLFWKRQVQHDPCAVDDDAGLGVDAAVDAAIDAGTDAGLTDAGVPDAGTCGLQTVDLVTMIVQPELGSFYEYSDFALLYVTPARPVVTVQVGDVFGDLERATAPMIDRTIVYIQDASLGYTCGRTYNSSGGGGCGGSYDPGYDRSTWTPPATLDAGSASSTVETIGPYEIVSAQPADEQQLAAWLDDLGYTYLQPDLDAVTQYLALGYYVVAVRLRPSNSLLQRTPPLAFTWQGTELRIPSAFGRTSQSSSDPLTVYVAANVRYELPNASIPFAMRTFYSPDWATTPSGWLLTRNEIQLDTAQPMTADPIAHATGTQEFRSTEKVTEEMRVPVSRTCGGHREREDEGLCADCSSSGSRRRQIDLGTIAVALLLVLRRRRATSPRGHQ